MDKKAKLNFKSLQRPNSEDVLHAISTDIAASSKTSKSAQQEMETDIKS